jgi:hypothetical protein
VKLIHNITFLVEHSIQDEWSSWIKDAMIPHFQASPEIGGFKLSKIVSSQNPDGQSFALQLEFESVVLFQQFAATLEPIILENHQKIFQDKALFFATTMEIIDFG